MKKEKQLHNRNDFLNITDFFRKDFASIIEMKGSDRLDLLNRLSTNALASLPPDTGAATVLTSEKGRIIDIMQVINVVDKSLCFCAPNNAETVVRWLKKFIIMDDVRLSDQSSAFAQFEVHGDSIHEQSQIFFDKDTAILPMFHPREVIIDDNLSCLTFRIPSVKSFGLKIVVTIQYYEQMYHYLSAIFTEVKDEEYQKIKILYGMPSFGKEIKDAYNPLEAGLLHYVNFKKGCYIGQEVIARLDSYNKVKQRIVGIVSSFLIQEGDTITSDGQNIGTITSVFFDEDEQRWFALAYVRTEHAINDTFLTIQGQQVYVSPFPLQSNG
ncbi:MAG TPA: glycine cleavage T C-terminal barrel domain-containing protein [Candidatus Kapabacteria bacterium]|nr:glycine cleavage T C-terminal barrel domain-containing protein [Candidatus Kapabacteria bacterium]